MRKRKGNKGTRADLIELLQGGRPLPDKLARKLLIVRPDEVFAEGTRLHEQGAALRSKLAVPPAKATGAQKKTFDDLRALTDKLRKRKPALPPPLDVGGTAWGSYSVVATPPYFTSQTTTSVKTGDPELSATADENTGEMSCRVVTSFTQASNGTAASYMALYFRPIFDSGTVRIHADMDIDFAWWVNSIGTKDATSRAQGLMRVYIANTFDVVSRGVYLGWLISKSHELDFNFGTYPSPSWSLNLPVTRDNLYQLVFSLECGASGVGWIGSIAGSQVAMRIPSVRFDFEWTPIVTGAI